MSLPTNPISLGTRCAATTNGYQGYAGVTFDPITGPTLTNPLILLTHPGIPDFIKNTMPTDANLTEKVANHIYELDPEKELFFDTEDKCLMRPDAINTFKTSDLHRQLCTIWIVNYTESLKDGLIAKIRNAFNDHNQGIKLAQDDLTAYGNLLLATMSFAHGYDPNASETFVFIPM